MGDKLIAGIANSVRCGGIINLRSVVGDRDRVSHDSRQIDCSTQLASRNNGFRSTCRMLIVIYLVSIFGRVYVLNVTEKS